jgi:hypothetical protein
MKFIEKRTNVPGYMNGILLHIDHRRVLDIRVAIFMVVR